MRALTLTAVVLMLAGCGRTALFGEPAGGPGGAGSGGSSNTGGTGQLEPFLADFEAGVLTGHGLDGTTTFSVTVGDSRVPELLAGTGDAVAWRVIDVSTPVFGLTRRDGTTMRDTSFQPNELWASGGRLTVTNGARSRIIAGGHSLEVTLAAFEAASADGHVPCLDERGAWVWVDATTEGRRVVTDQPFSRAKIRRSGDRLYAATAAEVIESTPTEDLRLQPPFANPQLISVNGARQAVVNDPLGGAFLLADFQAARLSSLRFENGGLTRLPSYAAGGAALELDDEGWVYAPYLTGAEVKVFRTRDLGATWSPVATVPAPVQLERVVVARDGDALAVLGSKTRGPSVEEWAWASVVDLRRGGQRDLPLAPQTTFYGRLPLALADRGGLVAYWEPAGADLRLQLLDVASGATTALDARPSRPDPRGRLPRLQWSQ